jgi:hypothetical protein
MGAAKRNLGLDVVNAALGHATESILHPLGDRVLRHRPSDDDLRRAIGETVRHRIDDLTPGALLGAIELLGRLGPAAARQPDHLQIRHGPIVLARRLARHADIIDPSAPWQKRRHPHAAIDAERRDGRTAPPQLASPRRPARPSVQQKLGARTPPPMRRPRRWREPQRANVEANNCSRAPGRPAPLAPLVPQAQAGGSAPFGDHAKLVASRRSSAPSSERNVTRSRPQPTPTQPATVCAAPSGPASRLSY